MSQRKKTHPSWDSSLGISIVRVNILITFRFSSLWRKVLGIPDQNVENPRLESCHDQRPLVFIQRCATAIQRIQWPTCASDPTARKLLPKMSTRSPNSKDQNKQRENVEKIKVLGTARWMWVLETRSQWKWSAHLPDESTWSWWFAECRHISGHENKIEPAMCGLWRQLHVHGAILARLLYCTSIAGS